MTEVRRSIFDCFMYRGELDALTIRLHELDRVVDYFVTVESNMTFSGQPRQISFDPDHPRLAPFVHKIRHVVVDDMPSTQDPWQREAWQRNAILRGTADASPQDLIVLSDVDEIPRADVIYNISQSASDAVFGLKMDLFYFFVDFKNVQGPQTSFVWSVAASRSLFNLMSPEEMRTGVRTGKLNATIVDRAGWHFSYLMDEEAIKRKIAAFSHQEYNEPGFLSKLNVQDLVRNGRDLFGRDDFLWARADASLLPKWLQTQREKLSVLFIPDSWLRGAPPP